MANTIQAAKVHLTLTRSADGNVRIVEARPGDVSVLCVCNGPADKQTQNLIAQATEAGLTPWAPTKPGSIAGTGPLLIVRRERMEREGNGWKPSGIFSYYLTREGNVSAPRKGRTRNVILKSAK